MVWYNTPMTTTTPETPACPDPHLYAFTVYKRDLRTRSGWRVLKEYNAEFPDERAAELHARSWADGVLVEYRKFWVLRRNFLSGLPYWEEWNTPHSCSPSTETYHSM